MTSIEDLEARLSSLVSDVERIQKYTNTNIRDLLNLIKGLSTINGMSILSGDDIIIKIAEPPTFSIDFDTGDLLYESNNDQYELSVNDEGYLCIDFAINLSNEIE